MSISIWNRTTLADAEKFEYLNGLWKGKKPPFEKAVVVRNTNFRNDGILDLSDVAVLDVETRQLQSRRLQKGDIIIERSGGGPKQPVGRVCYFNVDDSRPHSFSNFTTTLRVKDREVFLPLFVHYNLLHLYQTGFTFPLQRATTGIRNLDFGAYQEAEIPMPPKPEQEKIAAVLWKIQNAIEVEENLIATTHELKQSTLRKLFSYGLDKQSQKETEIGPMPEKWDLLPLSKICSFASGGTPSKARPDYWKGSIPWASPKDMKKPRLQDAQDHISQTGLEAGSTLVPANSLFVVIRGMILMRDVPVALTEVPMAFNQDIKAILPGERVAADYLLYAFTAYKGMLFQKVGRSAHGTRTLISPELAKFFVPVPPPEEQKVIATIMHAIDRKVSVHERRRAALSDLFLTLLNQLMTTQIRVDKLDIDTSEVTA
jgi:type I restriction enzyme S subunit